MANQSLDIQELFGVKDLVAVITGGGTGIGLMMAQALEANGAIVYIIGRRKETLEKAAATAKHGNIIPLPGDVTSKDSLRAAAAHMQSAHGHVDILVANAAITGPGGLANLSPDATVAEYAAHVMAWGETDFTDTFKVNVTGVFFTVAAFLELLDAGNKKSPPGKQRSQIIVTSSIGAFNRVPIAGFAYGASKAATVQLVKQLSTGLGKYHIRANVIAPGLYPSEMTTDLIKKWEKAGWKNFVPEQRAGDAQDMGGAILFLTSKAGAYINGNVLVTDGGRLGIIPSSY